MRQLKLRKTILITMITVITVAVVLVGYISGRQFEKILTDRVVNDYQRTVNTIRQNTETLIAYAEDFAKYLSLDDTLRNSLEEYQNLSGSRYSVGLVALNKKWEDISTKLIFSTSMIHNLDVYSEDDLVYSYHDLQAPSKGSIIPSEIISRAISQSSPVWTDLLTLTQHKTYNPKDEYGFAVVKSVRGSSANIIGAIAVYVRESSFSELLKAINSTDQGRCYLISDGKIVAGNDPSALYSDISAQLSLTQAEYEQCSSEGMFLKEVPNNTPVLYISEEIQNTNLRVVCEVTLGELSVQKHKLETFLIIIECIALAAAFFSARFASDRITRPLGELMSVMQKIKEDGGSSHLRFSAKESGEIGVLGTSFNELMDSLDASREQVYQEQRQRRHNEVRLLQAQIVPHFLYNTLGIVSSFIKLGMKQEAIDVVQKLASFYRLSLSSGKEIIPISDEIELTKNYMELQKLRYIEYMEFSIEFDEEVKEILIPKLTLQPLIENILHHALKPTGEICNICVNIHSDNTSDGVIISVFDNGLGMKEERLTEVRQSIENGTRLTDSFGVLNVHQRLKLMYGDRYHMEINSEEDKYTEFKLYLPGNMEDRNV